MTAGARRILTELFLSAVAGAAPGPATARAIASLPAGRCRRARIIATGKAAGAMADSALQSLRAAGIPESRGIVVVHDPALPSAPGLERAVGEHPLPGPGSVSAADAIGRIVSGAEEHDLVLVLLSGGTSSLTAAPVDGITPAELRQLHAALLPLGLPIGELNALRKRWSRWGAGRLAAAVPAATVECLALSDVPGDRIEHIGSGPCVGDHWTAEALLELIARRGIADRIPAVFERQLQRIAAGELPETVKPGAPELRRSRSSVIAGNLDALQSAAARASSMGIRSVICPEPLADESRAAGKRIALQLLRGARSERDPVCFLWGGETTVALPAGAPLGGRAQELALAAARTLHSARPSVPVTLLAAGTDGRDGTTDAAGAIVSAESWKAMQEAGAAPERALVRHESHAALDAAGLLLKTGSTGTNVMDVVIGLVGVP